MTSLHERTPTRGGRTIRRWSLAGRLYAAILASTVAHGLGWLYLPLAGFIVLWGGGGDGLGPGPVAYYGAWAAFIGLWILFQWALLRLSRVLVPMPFPMSILAVGATLGILAGFALTGESSATIPTGIVGKTWSALAITFSAASLAAFGSTFMKRAGEQALGADERAVP